MVQNLRIWKKSLEEFSALWDVAKCFGNNGIEIRVVSLIFGYLDILRTRNKIIMGWCDLVL